MIVERRHKKVTNTVGVTWIERWGSGKMNHWKEKLEAGSKKAEGKRYRVIQSDSEESHCGYSHAGLACSFWEETLRSTAFRSE